MRAGLATGGLIVALAAGGAGSAAGAVVESTPTPVAKQGTALAQKRSISREALRHRLRRALRSAHASSGAYVFDIDARHRKRLFKAHPDRRRIPASNEKLFTTAAAIDRFGADGHLVTRLYRRGHRRGPDDRVLAGNLVLVGDGDPALATGSFAAQRGLPLTRLSALADDVAAAGIRRVRGRILADDSIFDRRRGVGATGWQPSVDLSPLSGLSFDSGFVDGHYAESPELVAARALKRMLGRHGIEVSGRVGRTDLSRRALRRGPLGRVRSPRLGRLAAATNKPSNNFFAEMLAKRMGARAARRGTTRRGARRVERFARRIAAGVRAVDGSGLGRGNRVSPHQVVALLAAMTRREGGGAFRRSLPIAGREGTVAGRMRGTAAQDRCRTKTGTLRDVSALSGYCRAGHGLVAFSILMNSVTSFDDALRAQDRMAALIARYRR